MRDAVLGRAARLSAGARRVLEAVAIVRPEAEPWLLEALAGDDLACLEEATTSGIIEADRRTGTVSFRHEVARLAIEETTPPDRRRALHRRAIELLAEPSAGAPDPARLAHHAAALDDAELVLDVRAARRARGIAGRCPPRGGGPPAPGPSLRRQSARRGPGAVSSLPPRFELFLTIQFAEAADAQREAIRCAGGAR